MGLIHFFIEGRVPCGMPCNWSSHFDHCMVIGEKRNRLDIFHPLQFNYISRFFPLPFFTFVICEVARINIFLTQFSFSSYSFLQQLYFLFSYNMKRQINARIQVNDRTYKSFGGDTCESDFVKMIIFQVNITLDELKDSIHCRTQLSTN